MDDFLKITIPLSSNQAAVALRELIRPKEGEESPKITVETRGEFADYYVTAVHLEYTSDEDSIILRLQKTTA